MRAITRIGISGLAAVGLLAGATSAAFADTPQPDPNGPISATVVVPSATTITLSETTIPTFHVTPGQPDTDTSLIVNVSTNAAGPGTLTAELPDGNSNGSEVKEDFTNDPAADLALNDSDFSVNGQAFAGGAGIGTNNPTVTANTWSGPSAANYPQTVSVTAPGTQPADTYSGTLAYTAVG